MLRKIGILCLTFLILTQIISLSTWAPIAMEFAKGNITDFSIVVLDEEIEEDGLKVAKYQDINQCIIHSTIDEVNNNKTLLYLHHSFTLDDGFATILYSPPNFA